MVLLIVGIIGAELAPSPALGNLPITITIVGVAVFTIPATMLMKRFGRKAGFIGSSLVTALAALLAAYAIWTRSFLLLCTAMVFMGSNTAFVNQYRFAAAESVEPKQVSKAVSFVLLGGVIAGILGPEIAKRTGDWLDYGLYTGSFVVLAILSIVVAVLLLLFLREVAPQEEGSTSQKRPLKVVVAQPTYLVAVLAGVISFGVMSFMMTATPSSMHGKDGYSLDQTGLVIQSHVIAMFLPSLFTGFIIARLGVLRVMGFGTAILFACVAVAAVDRTLLHYWGALVLLGLGWNFVFVGATVLLTRSYRPSERFQAQAVNDFLIFGIQAFTSLLAGAVIYYAGWKTLSLLNLPFLLVLLVTIAAFARYEARPARGGLAAITDSA
jgi:predicted MFS family arabinose efflux permease